MSDNMLPLYNTKTFSDVFPTFEKFQNCFDNDFQSYAKNCIPSDNLKTLYWLLFARYGSNPIVNSTVNLFKAKLVANTFQKGPTWVKRLSLQESLRNLSDDDLLSGARTILNRALHPETEPGTNTAEELAYINQQDVSKVRRSKIDAYSYLNDVLKNDVTEEFLNSYAKLFSKFVSPTISRIYENDIDEEEENS